MEVLGLVDVPWWGILLTIIIVYLAYSSRDFNYFWKQGIPCRLPLPLVGTLYEMFLYDMITSEKRGIEACKAKGCAGGFFGSTPLLIVHDAEMLSEIMVKEFPAFPNRISFPTGTLSDHMLTNMKDGIWKHMRNEMTPTFTTGKLKRMNEEINRCARALTESFIEPSKSGEMVEMKEYMGAFTMDVIASTGFGIRLDTHKDRNDAFVQHARRAFDVKLKHPVQFLRIVSPAFNSFMTKIGFPLRLMPKETEDFFREIGKQAMEIRKSDADQSRVDFLQLMIKAQRGENIKDNEDDDKDVDNQGNSTGVSTDAILANALLFFVAGYDTTASSLSFFMHNMAINPDIQEKVVEEINTVVGNKDVVDYSCAQEMPYLDKCVQESLRMYPIVLSMNRVATRDVTIKGVFIRKGLNIGLPFYAIHHDPAKWPEPDKFDPERFSPENKKDRNPFHYLPFGYGPRNCIGMRLALLELKVAISHVLRKFMVTPCEKTEIPVKIAPEPGLLKPKDGIWLKMVSRNDK